MSRTTKQERCAMSSGPATVWRRWGLCLALFPVSAAGQEAPTFRGVGFRGHPAAGVSEVLLSLEAVQERAEDDRCPEEGARRRSARRFAQKFQQARREAKDLAKFRETRDALQRDRKRRTWRISSRSSANDWTKSSSRLKGRSPLTLTCGAWGFVGPPLAERLKLSEDQARRAQAIFEEGQKRSRRPPASRSSIDTKSGPPTMEAIRKLVETPGIQGRQGKSQQGRPGREHRA